MERTEDGGGIGGRRKYKYGNGVRSTLRGRMIGVNLGIMLAALLLCGGVFILSVYTIIGDYIHHDLDYFLSTTTDQLEQKLEFCEDIVCEIRKSDRLMNYLTESGGTSVEEGMEEGTEIGSIFSKAVDISSADNLAGGNIPIVEECTLFDRAGNSFHTGYYAMIYAQEQKSRETFRKIYESFCADREEGKTKNYGYYPAGDDSVYLAFLLFDEEMDPSGTLIFKIKTQAIRNMMEGISGYQGGFWALCDMKGTCLDGVNTGVFLDQEEGILNSFLYRPQKLVFSGREYRLYRKIICMDLQVVCGFLENQTGPLMYGSVKIYVAAILIILTVGCALYFVFIYRTTKPLTEITGKLKEVGTGNFETKLPDYPSREFHEISRVFNEMTEYVNHLIKQVYEKQITIKEMELKFLQTQMNPHFMFNVLSTIALQARLDRNDELYKMISSFNQLIQAKIYRDGSEKVRIRQELEYVEYYLYLQRYRFGDRLTYQIRVEDEELKDLYIPKLCIQVVAENAVVHGIEPKIENGTVEIRVYAFEDLVCIDVTDDGVGFDTEKMNHEGTAKEEDTGIGGSHNHVGLANSRHIIELMYGNSYGITVDSKPGEGTRARIRIPFDYGGGQGAERCIK